MINAVRSAGGLNTISDSRLCVCVASRNTDNQ